MMTSVVPSPCCLLLLLDYNVGTLYNGNERSILISAFSPPWFFFFLTWISYLIYFAVQKSNFWHNEAGGALINKNEPLWVEIAGIFYICIPAEVHEFNKHNLAVTFLKSHPLSYVYLFEFV